MMRYLEEELRRGGEETRAGWGDDLSANSIITSSLLRLRRVMKSESVTGQSWEGGENHLDATISPQLYEPFLIGVQIIGIHNFSSII